MTGRALLASLSFWAIVWLSACDCSGGVSLTVRLQSGLRAGVEARYADVRVLRGVSRCEPGAIAAYTDGRVLEATDQSAMGRGTLTIASLEHLDPGLYTVRVRMLRPPASPSAPADSGASFMERCVAVTLTSDRVLRIAITADCIDVVCPTPGGDDGFDQCLNGRCVDPRCDPEDPSTADFCCDRALLGDACDTTPTLCRAADDCPGGPACAGATRCETGACIEADDDLCGPGQHCSASEDACVEDPVFLDAGVLDASRASLDTGPPDAGPPGMGLLCDPCVGGAECDGAALCAPFEGAMVCVPTCTEADPTCPVGFGCMAVGGDRACLPLGGACCVDGDGDGYGVGRGCLGPDCDDTDPDRSPGHVELCNGADDDCDGTPDDPPTECASGRCDPDGAAYAESGAEACMAGTCMPSGGAMSCGLFSCDGGGDSGDRCARTCTALGADDDRLCIAAAHCDAGVCAMDVASGGGCDEDGDCVTGACEGGLCCTPGVGGCMCPGGPVETVCDDGVDSDCDGAVDCADADCAGDACGPRGRVCSAGACTCPGGASESACGDAADNDCDALVDCADADCAARSCGSGGRLCVGTSCACPGGATETQCGDGGDNDCDGASDCADADCEGRVCGAGRVCGGGSCRCAASFETSCSDGGDNDCDGAIDCADTDCAGQICADGGRVCSGGSCACSGGGTETRCDDGADGDCDLAIDCDDADCASRTCGPNGRVCSGSTCLCPGGTTERCDDSVDNDCNGLVDCADPDCGGMACAPGRACASGVCTCAGGPTEMLCGDGADNDCDGLMDCADPDCTRRDCGGGMQCCGACMALPPMYTHYETTALMCPTMLGGASYPGLCSLALFYTSDCGPHDMAGWAPGWTHASSSPDGCDYNACVGSSCQENFCIPCPGGDCNACPDNPPVTSC